MTLNKQSIIVIIHVQLVHVELFTSVMKLYKLSTMVIIHVQGTIVTICSKSYMYLCCMVHVAIGSCPPLIDEA